MNDLYNIDILKKEYFLKLKKEYLNDENEPVIYSKILLKN